MAALLLLACTAKAQTAGLVQKQKITKKITCQRADSIVVYEEYGYQWTKITCCAEFSPRDGAGALVFNDSLRLIGGWNPKDKRNFPAVCNNAVWSSPDGMQWVLTKPNSFISKTFKNLNDWEGRHTAGYVVFDDKMWIVGGDANQGHYQSDIWNSADGKRWNAVQHKAPWGPRVLHYTVSFKNRIWVIGGQTLPQFAKTEDAFYNDVWCSDDGVNWEIVVEEAPFEPRGMISGCTVFKNRIWILGGGTYDTPTTKARTYYNDVWSSADGKRWKQVCGAAPWAPRQYHGVAVWDNKLWVIAGYNQDEGGNRNDVWFSKNGKDWHELPKTPWKERHAPSIFVFDDALWVVTGNNMEGDVWRLSKILAPNVKNQKNETVDNRQVEGIETGVQIR